MLDQPVHPDGQEQKAWASFKVVVETTFNDAFDLKMSIGVGQTSVVILPT